MRTLLILLSALFIVTTATADNRMKQYDKVVITLTDGRVFDIEIDEASIIYSYVKEKDSVLKQYVEVVGVSEVYIFERLEMLSVKFVEETDWKSEENVAVVNEMNPIRYINGELVMHNSLNGETLEIFDLSGIRISEAVVRGNANIPMHAFPAGKYIVTVKDLELKVIVQ